MKEITNFLDNNSKIKLWPAKSSAKLKVLKYLANKFEFGVEYSEKQVNEIISNMHTFNDYFLLRRELINNKLMLRTRDGSKYWKNTDFQERV